MKKYPLILSYLVVFFVAQSLLAQKNKENLPSLTFVELDSLMMAAFGQRQLSVALEYAEAAALKTEQEVGEKDSIYINYLAWQGYLHDELQNYNLSESVYTKALQIAREVQGEQHPNYLTICNNIGLVYSKQGKYERAEPIYLEVVKSREGLLGKEHADYATSVNNLAILYQKMGRYDEAKTLYVESKEIRKKVLGEKHIQYAIALNNLASLYVNMAKYEEADLLFLETIALFKELLGEKHSYYAVSINNLANLYEDIGRDRESEKLYQKVIAIYNKLPDVSKVTAASPVNGLALLYQKMGQNDAAELLFREAIGMLEIGLGTKHPRYAQALNNLGNLYSKTGRFDEAEVLYLEAMNIQRKALGNSHPNYAQSLDNMSKHCLRKKEMQRAYAYNLAGLASNATNFERLFPGLLLKDEEGAYLDSMACCPPLGKEQYLLLEQLDFLSPIELNQSLKTLLNITKAAYQLAQKSNAADAQIKIENHFQVSKVAMQINENIRNGFSGKTNKLRVLEENNVFVSFGLEAALELGNDAAIKEAFAFAEQNKSILLADAVKGNRARNLGDLPDSLVFKEMDLQKKKDDLRKEKYEAKNDSIQQLVTAKENSLNEEIDAFLESLKDKYPKYHQLKYANIFPKVEAVQALLDDKTLFLEYVVADSVTYLFVVAKNKVELWPISITKNRLKAKVKNMRYNLSNYVFITKEPDVAYRKYTEIAYWFYSELLAKALKDKDANHLIVVADEALGHLPFEAFLKSPAKQGRMEYKDLDYLLKSYTITYNYSASLWKENLTSSPKQNNHQMFACASAYPKTDSSLLQLRSPHHVEYRQHLMPLPAAQKEVLGLSKHFKGVFLQNDSTNEAYFKQNAGEYGVLHLAMHGLLHPQVPMFSSLAFTENKDSLEDNFLQAFEIARLNLNADLVVLSACETGYGKFEQGEGVISLARSFMYAGTPSLVVSLWQVNDVSTANIMKHFYENLAEGMPKDEALRQAKLHYLEIAQGKMRHPAFWSPFIQLGDNRPIILTSKGNYNYFMLLGGILALAVLGFFVLKRKRKETV